MRTAAIFALLCAVPAAAAPMTVAVLYFDNHTSLREYDVLQKGLADMLITDLGQSDQLAIVEREKLDALMGELKLQKSKFFDPATALKLGKIAGAGYAITGAFTGLDPDVRIDVRMIDVTTSKVVVTAQVKGSKDTFFDLEQQLVGRFLSALAAKAPAGGAATVTLAHALKYSQSLDTADQGDVKAASTQMAAVVRDAPEFQLAKTRYTQLLKRLREAGKRRDEALSADETDLLKGFDAAFAKFSGKVLEGNDLEVYFCYRAMRTAYLMWKLEQPLGPAQGPLKMKVGDPAVVKPLLMQIWDNELATIADATKNHGKLQYLNHAASCPMALARVDKSVRITDFSRLRTLGVPWYPAPRLHPADRAPDLMEFAAIGSFHRAKFEDDEAEMPTLSVMPTLFVLDPGLAKKGLEVLDAADKHLHEKEAPGRSLADATLALEMARAVVFLAQGKREDGIAALQSWLDKNPKAKAYKAVEGQVEALLGVSAQAKKDGAALSRCAASGEQLERELDRLFDAEGPKVVAATVGKLDSRCAAQANGVAAWMAAVRGDCAAAKGFVAKAGSEDVAGVKTVCDGRSPP